jgi:hypothetical protein
MRIRAVLGDILAALARPMMVASAMVMMEDNRLCIIADMALMMPVVVPGCRLSRLGEYCAGNAERCDYNRSRERSDQATRTVARVSVQNVDSFSIAKIVGRRTHESRKLGSNTANLASSQDSSLLASVLSIVRG